MIKKPQRLLLTTILLTVLLSSSLYAILIPSAHAAEMTTQQKGLGMLRDVVGLDLTKYNVTTQENSYSPPFLGNVLQENVLYNLTSANSRLKAFYTFANGNLQGIYVLENEGTPSLTKSVVSGNAVERAQVFLSDYQAYTAKPIFGELKSTLDNVDASKNLTKTFGNKVLQVTAYGDRTHFKWYYTANGAIAPYTKVISVGFRNGFLSSFIDNWNLYNIGSNTVNLSKEEAIAIALNTARNHSWTMQLDENQFDPTNFNEKRSISWAALTFDGSLDANKTRSEDVLELYPVWRVGVVLNKVYGELYGIEVDIWADTKEVRSVKEEYSQLAAQWFENSTANVDASAEAANQSLQEIPTGSSNNEVSSAGVTLTGLTGQASDEIQANTPNEQALANGTEANFATGTVLPVIVVTMVGAFVVGLFRKKHARALCQLKPRSVKTCGILLGFLILLVVFLPLVATANATSRAGNVWGARSSGAPNHPYSYSWRKTDGEISRQWAVTSYIVSNFFTAANGYSGFSNEGVNKDVILYQAGYFSNNYDYVAIVDWDHGVGGYPVWNEAHYMFEDDWGTVVGSPSYHYTDWSHGVFDMDIYNVFPPAKVHFAFIDACYSANLWLYGQGFYPGTGNPVGLPFAFTHRIVTYVPAGYSGTSMSDDGYNRPDAFPQCYIGFPTGSAALDQNIPYETPDTPWKEWVIFFFYLALDFDMCVKGALDIASNLQWQCDGFWDSPLTWPGFTAVWPMDLEPPWGEFEVGPDQQGPHSTLAVYGNSNIHLKNFQPSDMVTWPSVGGPTIGDAGVPCEFSAYSIDSHGHNIQYRFDWGDGSYTETGVWYSNGVTERASHSWSPGIYSVRVQARCPNTGWSSWSTPRTISIDQYWLTVDAWDTYYGYPLSPNVWIDGDWAGYAPVMVPVSEGWHSVTVDEWYEYFYLTGFSDGYGNGDYRPIYSETWITAYYQGW